MTTAVYVRGRYLAADKRSTGGHTGINNNVSKIFEVKSDTHHVYAVFAGMKMMKGLVDSLVRKHLFDKITDLDFQKGLYDFKEEVKDHAGDNFECILLDKNNDLAYMITHKSVEEITNCASIGSGSYYSEGILLRDPKIEPAMLFKLVSTKDIATNEFYDIINLE